MCSPAIAIGLTVASGAYQAYQQNEEGKSEGAYYDYLSQQSSTFGNLALQRGQQQSTLIQDQAAREGKDLKQGQAQFSAAQRARMANAGIAGVTAEDISNDTFSKQKMDEINLRYNADIKSWETEQGARDENFSLQSESQQYGIAGKNARKAGKTRAFSTLLGTASSVASSNLLKAKPKPKFTAGSGKAYVYNPTWRR